MAKVAISTPSSQIGRRANFLSDALSRKLQAVDFFGAGLTLAGSTLLIVRCIGSILASSLQLLTVLSTAWPDLGWWRVPVGICTHSRYNCGRGSCLWPLCTLAMEGDKVSTNARYPCTNDESWWLVLTPSLVHIFRNRMTNGALLTMFVNGWNFVVQVYYIPNFYQLAYGYSAVKAGALLLPLTLIQSTKTSYIVFFAD